MRSLVRALAIAAVVLGASPAHAFVRDSPPSVFPHPRDQWSSWGVRRDLPRHVGAPRDGDRVVIVPAPQAFWVPGRWFWDGMQWVWWPGHWAR